MLLIDDPVVAIFGVIGDCLPSHGNLPRLSRPYEVPAPAPAAFSTDSAAPR